MAVSDAVGGCALRVVRLGWMLIVHLLVGVAAGAVAASATDPWSAANFVWGVLGVEAALFVSIQLWVVPSVCRYLRTVLLGHPAIERPPTHLDGVLLFAAPAVILSAVAASPVPGIGVVQVATIAGVVLVGTIAILVGGGRRAVDDWRAILVGIAGVVSGRS